MLRWYIAGRIVSLLARRILRLHHGDTTFPRPVGGPFQSPADACQLVRPPGAAKLIGAARRRPPPGTGRAPPAFSLWAFLIVRDGIYGTVHQCGTELHPERAQKY